MKSSKQNVFVLSAIAGALLVAFGPARAGDNEVTQLTRPDSQINAGAAYVDKDNQRFGEYTGLTKEGTYGIVDFSLVRRNDSAGTSFSLYGRNLGYEDRELRLEQKRQGDWGYFVDYSRIPRYDPYTVSTRLAGMGTTNQVENGNPTAADYHLKTTRDRWTLGFEKALGAGWDVQVRYRNEQKDGSRLYGQGTFGSWRFLTDLIDQTTQQIDALMNYNTERFQLTAGYYGTSFVNNNSKINTTAQPPLGAAPFTEAALPPGNQSHQVYVTGGYNLTKLTRGTFKLAAATITQNDAWPTTPVPGITRTGLDGRIDTLLAQAGLSGHATPKLSWRADLRYEDRNDMTPVDAYWPSQNTPTSTSNGSNEPRDIKTTTAKAVAHYALPMGFRLTGDLGYEQKNRSSPPVRSVVYREKTDETTLGIEMRRAVAETLTGALGYVHSDRGGSGFLVNYLNNGTTIGSNLIAPLHLADRTRDLVRLSLNWIPTDPLSINFRVDEGQDKYTGTGQGLFDLGPKKGKSQNYSLDAAYAFSDAWSGTAWYQINDNRAENKTCASATGTNNACNANLTANPVWGANVKNLSDTYGLGLRGNIRSNFKIGADLTQSKVRDEFDLSSIAGGAVVSPADITTKVTTFKLWGDIGIQRNSGVRLEYTYDRYQTDDWTWANWVYTDGTTVLQNPNQKVNFVGASYYYRFQ